MSAETTRELSRALSEIAGRTISAAAPHTGARDAIIEAGLRAGAEEIYIRPVRSEPTRIDFRINGELCRVATVPVEYHDSLRNAFIALDDGTATRDAR